jgi:hypothetical protein
MDRGLFGDVRVDTVFIRIETVIVRVTTVKTMLTSALEIKDAGSPRTTKNLHPASSGI